MIVAVVDYRAGNLSSVVKALAAAGATPRVVTRTAGLSGAHAIVVPGVGHFDASRVLDDEDRRVIAGYVQAGVPLLGICLGMQWLFEGSEESPELPGLGVFSGRCARLGTAGSKDPASENRISSGAGFLDPAWASENRISSGAGSLDPAWASENRTSSEAGSLDPAWAIKIPHVGWNTLEPTGRPSRILGDLPAGATAYFTHSYAAPDGDGTVARTTHGATFASVVERGRVFGTQFHPEKSGTVGVEMLRRFVEVAREASVQC